MENPTVEQLNSISELDINYSLNSLEDILYLPNLKRLNLAGNRYQYEPELSNYYNTTSVLYDDINRSIFALEIAHEVYGLKCTGIINISYRIWRRMLISPCRKSCRADIELFIDRRLEYYRRAG